MTETKTETLADVLRELSELAPERFDAYDSDDLYDIGVVEPSGREHGYVFDCSDLRIVTLAILQVACQQECEAQGWHLSIEYDPATRMYCVAVGMEDESEDVEDEPEMDVPLDVNEDPAFALATALRDALKRGVR